MFSSFVRRSCATNGSAIMRSSIKALPKATTTTTPVINHAVVNTTFLDTPQRRSFSDDTTTATFDLSGAFEVCNVSYVLWSMLAHRFDLLLFHCTLETLTNFAFFISHNQIDT